MTEWFLKYDDERSSRRWTAVGPTGRLGDVDTAETAIALLRAAGAPATASFIDACVDDESSQPATRVVEDGPVLRAVVIDTTNARATAEFYRQLLRYTYRSGDEAPVDGEPDPRGSDWLVLLDATGEPRMSFQQVEQLAQTTWPDPTVPMQLHVDLAVSNNEELRESCERARDLGATVLMDRTDDPDEPLYVLADPAGHPFCLLVG